MKRKTAEQRLIESILHAIDYYSLAILGEMYERKQGLEESSKSKKM